MKSKYCYIIVSQENGSMLLEDGKLPIYWNREVAKERLRRFVFRYNYVIHKIELADIENLILKSKQI